jgi:hypothetical protein
MFNRSLFNCGGRIMKRDLHLIMLALVACPGRIVVRVRSAFQEGRSDPFSGEKRFHSLHHSIRACSGIRTPWRAARRARGQPGSRPWW